MDHVDQAQAEHKPDSQESSVASADTLEGVLGEPTTIENCQVTVSCAKIELHKLDREEDSGHDFWGYAKALTG